MTSSDDSLVVVLCGQPIGRLDREPGGEASFTYDSLSLERPSRPQLSVRLPLRGETFPPARVLPFLDGLLPENQEVRRQQSNAKDVPDDPMSLLSVMGWDCPGAVQISPPEQVEQMLGRPGGLDRVTDDEIGARIARLGDHPTDWTLLEERWSLSRAAGEVRPRAGRAGRRLVGLPENKYEDRGGLTVSDVAQISRTQPSEDVRVAPLYDLATRCRTRRRTSAAASRWRSAVSAAFDRIHAAQWSRASREIGVPEHRLRDRARQLLLGLPDYFHRTLVEVGTPEAEDV